MSIFNFFSKLFGKKQTTKQVDLLGNKLKQGDSVVEVLYNEMNRRGYLTLEESYSVKLFDKNQLKQNVIKYNALTKLLNNKENVKAGRKHGYLHIMVG